MYVVKCPDCGKKYIKYPVKQQQDKDMATNIKEGTVNWKNLLKIDWLSVLMLLTVLAMLIGYNQLQDTCEEAITDTCTFCENKGCCQYQTQDPQGLDQFEDFEIS